MNILQLLGIDGAVSDPSAFGAPPPAPVATGDPSVTDGIPGFGDFSGAAPQPGNVMQTIPGGTADATSQPPPAPMPAPAPAQPAAAPAGTQPARSRSSVLDKLGRLADVIATVGGANPLYQPTLDARQNRVLALGDHDRSVTGDLLDQDAKRADIAQTHGAIAETQNGLRDAAIKHLQAMVAANPNTDVSKVWPMLAAQANLPADETAQLGQIFAADPKSIEALSDVGGDKSKYGGMPVYVRDPQGNLHIRQLSLTGDDARDPLPEGWTPADPTKAVNFGGTTGFVGAHSDTPSHFVTNTEKPGQAADRAERARESDNHNAIEAAKPGKAGKTPAGDPYTNFANGVRSLTSLDKSLADLVGDPNLSGATGLIGGRLNVSDGQRTIKGKIESLTGQAIPAAIAAIKSSGGASPRAVSEIMGEVKGLVGAIQNRDMPTAAYVANVNAARARLRQRMSDLTADAVRQGFAVRGANGRISPRSAAPAARPAPAVPVTRPVLPSTPPGGLHDFVPWGKR